MLFITGATHGIGLSIAHTFAAQGFSIAFCARNTDEVKALEYQLQTEYNIKAIGKNLDVQNTEALLDFVNEAQQTLEPISVLVNNAGQYAVGTLLDTGAEQLMEQCNINVVPAYALCQHIGKSMKQNGKGHIINICSIASVNIVPDAANYSLSKMLLYQLSKILQTELQPFGVKVTSILPAATLTRSWQGVDNLPANILPAQVVADACWKVYKDGTLADVILN